MPSAAVPTVVSKLTGILRGRVLPGTQPVKKQLLSNGEEDIDPAAALLQAPVKRILIMEIAATVFERFLRVINFYMWIALSEKKKLCKESKLIYTMF
ncbi:hypothetical protein CEXT_603121 [Caerostris extrusa]|uniref:Uncharacterized protein n=1 Tax=Caerostris extrusa TaxID=172846 RepID=A0AAV4NMN6_CAEEX|nr:hypothetical protein CEXT_603121 [Caerostris extrusa]